MSDLTVLLGASPQKERYSYLAFRTLEDQGRAFVLVNPKYPQIEGREVKPDLDAVEGPVDTVSVYLSPAHQGPLLAPLLRMAPRRVIFNPGAENPDLEKRLTEAGIACLEACTLVLLRTGQY